MNLLTKSIVLLLQRLSPVEDSTTSLAPEEASQSLLLGTLPRTASFLSPPVSVCTFLEQIDSRSQASLPCRCLRIWQQGMIIRLQFILHRNSTLIGASTYCPASIFSCLYRRTFKVESSERLSKQCLRGITARSSKRQAFLLLQHKVRQCVELTICDRDSRWPFVCPSPNRNLTCWICCSGLGIA